MKRALVVAVCLLATMLPGLPSRAMAGPGLATEADAIQLPGVTYQAVIADLDADGARELVRLIGVPEPSQAVAVDIWAERGDTWVPLGQPVLLRRRPDPGEATAYDRSLVDSSGRLRVATPDGTRLVVLRAGSSERVVVATSLTVNRSCCLSLLGIELSAGAPALVPLADRLPAADSALALDADGDGTDELFTRDAPIRSRQLRAQRLDDTLLRRLRLYRVGSRSLTELAVGAPPIRTETPFVLGDSDGIRGQEAGMIDPSGSGRLARISWDGAGPLTVEQTELFGQHGPRLKVTGAAALPGGMLVASNASSTHLARWPAGSTPQWTGALGGGGQLLGTLGSGDQLRIVLRDPNTGGMGLLDAAMRGVETLGTGSGGDGLGWLPQYAGPLPGATGGSSSIIVDGRLLSADRGPLRIRPIANLVATYPVGLAGSADHWLALLRAREITGRERGGGRLRSLLELGPGSVTIAPAGEVLASQPAVATGEWLAFERSAAIASAAGTPTLAVASTGYAARLRVPPGSLVLSRGAEDPERIPIEVSGEVTVRFPAAQHGPAPRLTVVTPTGRGYEAAWSVGRVIDAPPPLIAAGSATLLVGAATIRGTTSPGRLLSVDGRALKAGSDGAFWAQVPAGLWPRSVTISASDELGQTSAVTLSVVGYLDYPRLPWLPMVSLTLLGVAACAAWRQRPGVSTLRADGLVEVEPGAAATALVGGRLPDTLQPRDGHKPGGRSLR